MIVKKLFLTLVILAVFVPSCFATQYYVFIEKNGYVAEGEEAGHNEKGDTVTAPSYTSQYKPTSGELAHFKVIVLDLTAQDREDLLEVDEKLVDGVLKVVRARKRKIDIDKLTLIKQEEVVNDKTIVLNELSIKPALIVGK